MKKTQKLISLSIFCLLLVINQIAAQKCDNFEDCITKGNEALSKREASDAKSFFKSAAKHTKVATEKNKAQNLRDIADDYDDKYLSLLEKSSKKQKRNDWKEAIKIYEEAAIAFQNINRKEYSMLLKSTDDQLLRKHKDDLSRLDASRQSYYKAKQNEGNNLLKSDPDAAQKALEEAIAQMTGTEFQSSGVQVQLKEAKFNQLVQEAKKQLASGNIDGANEKISQGLAERPNASELIDLKNNIANYTRLATEAKAQLVAGNPDQAYETAKSAQKSAMGKEADFVMNAVINYRSVIEVAKNYKTSDPTRALNAANSALNYCNTEEARNLRDELTKAVKANSEIAYLKDGNYMIELAASRLVLDAEGGSVDNNGCPIMLWRSKWCTENSRINQTWALKGLGNGRYQITT
jgi:hypothetical protein